MSVESALWVAGRVPRGCLYVFEGGDGVGKSTQARLLTDALAAAGGNPLLLAFPQRQTAVGALLNQMLRGERAIRPRVSHLLFAANRWELAPRIEQALADGRDVVLDRYWYSGAAYTMQLDANVGMDWCLAADAGLPQPDSVFLLQCDAQTALGRVAARDAAGSAAAEIYDKADFQRQLCGNFHSVLVSARPRIDFLTVDATRSAGEVHANVMAAIAHN